MENTDPILKNWMNEFDDISIYSVTIDYRDQISMKFTIKYYDSDDRIFDEVYGLIDRKNNLVWLDNSLDYNESLEKAIRELLIIRDINVLHSEFDALMAFYYSHCNETEIEATKKFPALFNFLGIRSNYKSLQLRDQLEGKK